MENRIEIFNFDDDKFKEIVAKSKTYNEICRKIGILVKKVIFCKPELLRKINKLGLDISHIKELECNEDLFYISNRLNSNNKLAQTFKYYLYENKLKEEICEKCGKEPMWMGKPLVLVLDHTNNIRTDNRLENLRILCPNCYNQAGRKLSRSMLC